MITIVWPLLVAIVGLVMWLISTNSKVNDIGRILFCIGAFWAVYLLCGSAFILGGGAPGGHLR